MTTIPLPALRRRPAFVPALAGRTPAPEALVSSGLVLLVIAASIAAQPWLDRIGPTRYQSFLHMEWLLAHGGKGLQLDASSLPLPPLLYALAATLGGPGVAEMWLPVVLAILILLVLTQLLLRENGVIGRLLPALLLIGCPFFYVVQRQLDLQLFVLLLGLHLFSVRLYRQQPSMATASFAVGVNMLFSLTSYVALFVIAASTAYLFVLMHRQREVEAPAWAALLWIYVPFSLAGYALWAVFWVVAGSRLATSYFLPAGSTGTTPLRRFLDDAGGGLVLPILLLFALALALAAALRRTMDPEQQRRGSALVWAAVTCIVLVLAWLTVQTAFERLAIVPAVITFGLVILVPAALGGLLSRGHDLQHRHGWLVPVSPFGLAAILLVVIPLRYLRDPRALAGGLVPVDSRISTEREAGRAFRQTDPGGRILLDPRFTADFVLTAQIDPHRLMTPFDPRFSRIVGSPPADISTVVVTESTHDDVSGNYPEERIADQLPDATLIAAGKQGDALDAPRTRAFKLLPAVLPAQNAQPANRDADLVPQEQQLLAAVQKELLGLNGLPYRPDGWAYAIDVGNLMVYAAHSGDLGMFKQFSQQVEQRYLVTRSNDPNALYTIAWRYQPGRPVEASGTTETLRMVEAYWVAGQRWNNGYYRRLAYLMALAYMRHQTSDQYGENWYIRNYYNYGTQGYATNSFLVDYDPDVLRQVADYTHDTYLRAAADKAAQFVTAAQIDNGLFQEMYQPELSTLYKDMLYFSPNGIIQLIDSLEAALGLSQIYAPAAAQKTYQFAKAQYLASGIGHVSNQYYEDGTPLPKGQGAEGGPAVYAYIARIGDRLGDTAFARRLLTEQLRPDQMYLSGGPKDDGNWFFAWTSALLAIREYQEAPVSAAANSPATAAPGVTANAGAAAEKVNAAVEVLKASLGLSPAPGTPASRRTGATTGVVAPTAEPAP